MELSLAIKVSRQKSTRQETKLEENISELKTCKFDVTTQSKSSPRDKYNLSLNAIWT